MEVIDIKLSEILASDAFNCRGAIAPIDVMDLADDIKEKGLLQPVVVRPIQHVTFKFQLVAGYRRFKAHQLLKKEVIPGIIRADISKDQAQIFNLTENIQRKNLNIVQEANAVKKLYDQGYSERMIGEVLKTSTGWAKIRLTLLELPEDIQKEAAVGLLTQQQILDIAALTSDDERYQAIRTIKDGKIRGARVKIKKDKIIDLHKKKNRSRTEIFPILDHILDTIDPCFATRCLAWCAGEITTSELLYDLQLEAKKQRINYVPRTNFIESTL